MKLSKNFINNALGGVAGLAVLGGVVVAFTDLGPDLTPVAQNAQKYADNIERFDSSFLDGDFIQANLPRENMSTICPYGFDLTKGNEDSLKLASWGKAISFEQSPPDLTLRIYSVGECTQIVYDEIHTMGFSKHYYADYNAYTPDEVLETRFEDDERFGQIIIEQDGYRRIFNAMRTYTLNEQTRVFDNQELYITLSNFRDKEPLQYARPLIQGPR